MPGQPDLDGSGMMSAHWSIEKGTALHEFATHVAKPLLPQTADLYSAIGHIQPCEACSLLAVSQLRAVTALYAGRQPQGKCP